MNDNRYAPPAAAVTDVERAPTDRPRNVAWAVRLLWLMAACALPAIVYELIVPPAGVSPTENILINLGALVFGLGVAWIFNTATWRGRNWGRWVNAALVTLGAISTMFVLLMTMRIRNGPSDLASYGLPWYVIMQCVVQNLIGVVAVVFLFTRSANAWFAAMKEL